MNQLLGTLLGRPEGPRRLGRYRVHDVLGRGGMGVVLEGYDSRLDRKVALKLLDTKRSERHAGRLIREAKALAKLSHPNVVQVYEVEEDRGDWFIAMELVDGETLRAWQERRPPWRECVRAYIQAGTGLAAAHAAGLTHRDFKPDNCIIDPKGRVRVLDFGQRWRSPWRGPWSEAARGRIKTSVHASSLEPRGRSTRSSVSRPRASTPKWSSGWMHILGRKHHVWP